MTTYTVAISDTCLLATVPDRGDIAAAVRAEARLGRFEDDIPVYVVTTGLTLTNDEPEDSDTIVWHSGNGGFLTDEHGADWNYATRA